MLKQASMIEAISSHTNQLLTINYIKRELYIEYLLFSTGKINFQIPLLEKYYGKPIGQESVCRSVVHSQEKQCLLNIINLILAKGHNPDNVVMFQDEFKAPLDQGCL